MARIFSLFGPSREVQRLDRTLRAAGLHPVLVSDAVKIAAIKLLRDGLGRAPDEADCAATAQILAYLMMGADDFAAANGETQRRDAERRIEAAITDDTGADARLILLALHAGAVRTDVMERFGLSAENG